MRRFNRILRARSREELEEMRYWCYRASEKHGYQIIPNNELTLNLESLEWSCSFSVIADSVPAKFSALLDKVIEQVKIGYSK